MLNVRVKDTSFERCRAGRPIRVANNIIECSEGLDGAARTWDTGVASTDSPSRLSTQDLSHVVTGVFRSINRPTYDDAARHQVDQARNAKAADLGKLLHGNDTWTVAAD